MKEQIMELRPITITLTISVIPELANRVANALKETIDSFEIVNGKLEFSAFEFDFINPKNMKI